MKLFGFFLIFLGCNLASIAKPSLPTQTVKVTVTEKGFEPSSIQVKPGSHVILAVTRRTDDTCATQMKIKAKNIIKELPLNQEVAFDLGTVAKGDIRFACGMDMISGHVIAE